MQGMGNRARVLVIDDEEMIGSVIRRMLAADCDVTPVTSAIEGLRLLRESGPFDLILCDLMMPEMNGMELYEELARNDPEMVQRIVFLTGGAFTLQSREFLDRVANPRLEKPFDAMKLRNLVTHMAPSRGGAAPGRPA